MRTVARQLVGGRTPDALFGPFTSTTRHYLDATPVKEISSPVAPIDATT